MDISALQTDFAHAVEEGFAKRPRSLAAVWHYDALGSLLFEAICLLPEYDLTRIENAIIALHADAIVQALGTPGEILELGSGVATKTIALLNAVLRHEETVCYRPVDVSVAALEEAERRLDVACPRAIYAPIARDYTELLKAGLPANSQRRLILFLGSNLGNYEPAAARILLKDLRQALKPGDGFLLGAALQRPAREVLAAYDDSLGVTAAFNKNILARINRELDANFDVREFYHDVRYDESDGAVHSFLVARAPQNVWIGALNCLYTFDAGEAIHTEVSYKYTISGIRAIGEAAGLVWVAQWSDPEKRFCDVLFVAQ